MQQRASGGLLSWFCYKTWYPFKTLRSVLILSVILGIFFISIAILQIALYLNTHEYQIIYANNQDCTERNNGNKCQNILEITEDLQPPITFIYFLQNAYINHRKYIDSVSPDQLAGKTIDLAKADKQCTPFPINSKIGHNQSYTGKPLDSNFVASPCGFTAKLVFNDTFKLFNSAGTQIPINQSNLFQNIYGQFKRPADSESIQWVDPEGEHFMIWMQNTGSITKYKLWGRIQQTLPAGKYNLVSENNFQIGDMRIKKGVMIVNPSALGSAVYFYPVVYIIMGLICFAFTIFMKVKLADYDALLQEFEKKQQ